MGALMGIQEEVANAVNDICTVTWNERTGQVIPETDDVVMRNGLVKVDATYLYADLADSTGLAQRVNPYIAARIVRAYLHASAKIIRKFNGAIRSFDGDRVMGIFIGGSKNSQAMRAAMGVNWAFYEVFLTRLRTEWPDLSMYWTPNHGVGVATGEAMIVRGGVVNSNDLVSVGQAPNAAAKLSDMRYNHDLYITSDVYSSSNDLKTSTDGRSMWDYRGLAVIGGRQIGVYGSTWWCVP
jgi:class 3 adenylate cyclase